MWVGTGAFRRHVVEPAASVQVLTMRGFINIVKFISTLEALLNDYKLFLERWFGPSQYI